MANPTTAAPNTQHVEVINIDVLDRRLTDDKIEWYCEWVKGGDPERRILVDEDTSLDSFLESVKSLIKIRQRKKNVPIKLAYDPFSLTASAAVSTRTRKRTVTRRESTRTRSKRG